MANLKKNNISKKDSLYKEALDTIVKNGRASTGLLQSKLKIGYVRASRILNSLEKEGYVTPIEKETNSRKILDPKAKKILIIKKDVKEDLINTFDNFREKKKEIFSLNDYKELGGKYSRRQISKFFKSKKKKKKELNLFKEKEKEKGNTYSREDFNIRKISKQKKHRFVVTSVIAGMSVNLDFLSTLKYYCSVNKAELCILPMRGVSVEDEFMPEFIEEIQDSLVTSYQFNKSLRAYDLKLNPQQRNPLTGLNSIGSKGSSIIIASPKMHMKIVPTGNNNNSPHMLHSTGTISNPGYLDSRQGVIAEEDHTYSALVVETTSDKEFHVRQLEALSDGSIIDLNTRYYPTGKKKENKSVAMYLGDGHFGWVDPDAKKCTIEQIKLLKPSKIYIGDTFDCSSVSHHIERDIEAQFQLPKHLKTLEKELYTYAKELLSWLKVDPKIEFNIIYGNHEDALMRYLREARYAKDRVENHYLSLELAKYFLDGDNPLEMWCRKNYPELNKYNINWLKIEDEIRDEGILNSIHGHKGAHGSRGSIRNIENSYGVANLGHSHSSGIFRKIWQAGTLSIFDMPYAKGGASGWTHSNIVINTEGVRQMLTMINGLWKA